jgi:hypothetical protein
MMDEPENEPRSTGHTGPNEQELSRLALLEYEMLQERQRLTADRPVNEFVPSLMPVLPYWKKRTRTYGWKCW